MSRPQPRTRPYLTLLAGVLGWSLMAPGHAAAELRTFALVVGTNVSDDPAVKPLRYADDDAVNNARLLRELGAEVVLLAQLDADTRRLFPDVREQLPTRAALDGAMGELNRRMDAARALGHSPVLYLFYSGHGDVENNRGYVQLHDGRYYRDDVLALIGRSTANENHLIVDACKSYFLVFERGAGKRAPLSGPLLGPHASLPANTGVVLSTSDASESHEWEAFQGGVFSHEIRSALRGAADQNLDRKVSYEEAAAFVWTANSAVPNARYRPHLFVRAPSSKRPGEAVLADTRLAGSDMLLVGPGVSEHLYVEDQLGRRLADFRPAAEQQVTLLVPRERPLYVREVDTEQEVELPRGRTLVLASLPHAHAAASRRGSEQAAFGKLFARTFGHAALADYRRCPPEQVEAIERARDLTWLRRSLGAAGAASLAVGLTMNLLARDARGDLQAHASGQSVAQLNARLDRYNRAALASYAAGGALVASYLLWTFWPEPRVEVQVLPGRRAAGATLSTKF